MLLKLCQGLGFLVPLGLRVDIDSINITYLASFDVPKDIEKELSKRYRKMSSCTLFLHPSINHSYTTLGKEIHGFSKTLEYSSIQSNWRTVQGRLRVYRSLAILLKVSENFYTIILRDMVKIRSSYTSNIYAAATILSLT